MSGKIGEQSWTANTGNGSGEGGGKVDYMRLQQGSNVVRILTLPHAYYTHKLEVEGGKRWGYRIKCSDPQHNEDCPVCKMGNKAKRKWLLGCTDKTGAWKVLDIGYSVYKGIELLVNDDAWGSTDQYDIDIVVNQRGTPQDYYRTAPKPKKPLTEQQLMAKEEHSTQELVKQCQPWTRERVEEMLAKIKEETEAHNESDLVMKGTGVSGETADDTDDFFTNYDATKSKK